jgi:hypothetical protein
MHFFEMLYKVNAVPDEDEGPERRADARSPMAATPHLLVARIPVYADHEHAAAA